MLPANPARESWAAPCLIHTSSPVQGLGSWNRLLLMMEERLAPSPFAGLCYAKHGSKNVFLSGNSVDMAQFKWVLMLNGSVESVCY